MNDPWSCLPSPILPPKFFGVPYYHPFYLPLNPPNLPSHSSPTSHISFTSPTSFENSLIDLLSILEWITMESCLCCAVERCTLMRRFLLAYSSQYSVCWGIHSLRTIGRLRTSKYSCKARRPWAWWSCRSLRVVVHFSPSCHFPNTMKIYNQRCVNNFSVKLLCSWFVTLVRQFFWFSWE